MGPFIELHIHNGLFIVREGDTVRMEHRGGDGRVLNAWELSDDHREAMIAPLYGADAQVGVPVAAPPAKKRS